MYSVVNKILYIFSFLWFKSPQVFGSPIYLRPEISGEEGEPTLVIHLERN